MGSSSKDTSAPAAGPQPGSVAPPGAAPFNSAGFPGAPFYQGFSAQPFNENNEVFASFLPGDPKASATGMDRNMLNTIMGISPQGTGRVPLGQGAPPEQAAAAKTTPLTPQEQAELNALQADLFFANTHNAGPGSAARLRAAAEGGPRIFELRNKSMTPEQQQIAGLRSQLALMAAGSGGIRERGSGPGYGSSGPGGVGHGGGRTA